MCVDVLRVQQRRNNNAQRRISSLNAWKHYERVISLRDFRED